MIASDTKVQLRGHVGACICNVPQKKIFNPNIFNDINLP